MLLSFALNWLDFLEHGVAGLVVIGCFYLMWLMIKRVDRKEDIHREERKEIEMRHREEREKAHLRNEQAFQKVSESFKDLQVDIWRRHASDDKKK